MPIAREDNVFWLKVAVSVTIRESKTSETLKLETVSHAAAGNDALHSITNAHENVKSTNAKPCSWIAFRPARTSPQINLVEGSSSDPFSTMYV